MTVPNSITFTNTSGEQSTLTAYSGALSGVIEGRLHTSASAVLAKTLLIPDLTAFDAIFRLDARAVQLVAPNYSVLIFALSGDSEYVESWLRYQLAKAHGMTETLKAELETVFSNIHKKREEKASQ